MRPSRKVAGRAAHEALVHDGDLQEVFGQSAGLQVVVVRLADAAKEAHGPGPPQLKVQHAQHEALGLENLVDAVARIHHVDDLLNRRTVDLFVFGGDEESGGANELKLSEGDDLDREEAIDVVDGEEQSLGEEAEPVVDLNQPVHEDRAHRPLNLGLVVHVVGVGEHLGLRWEVSKCGRVRSRHKGSTE